jgi:hypothetical protein
MAANDDFPTSITRTAQASGAVPAITFPACPGVSWRLSDISGLVTPAKWTGVAVADTVDGSVIVSAVGGVSPRITAGTFRAFCEVAGAVGNGLLFEIQDSLGTKWVDVVNLPVVNSADSCQLTGELSGAQGGDIYGYFPGFAASRQHSIALAGYCIYGVANAPGQLLRVWDGPSGTGQLIASYLMSNIGGQDGSYSGSPELTSQPGNALTIDTDGAVAAPTFSLTGNLAASYASTPSETSLLATAAAT